MAAQVREISAVKDQQMKEAAEKSARSVFGKAVSIFCVSKWNNEMIDRIVCKNISPAKLFDLTLFLFLFLLLCSPLFQTGNKLFWQQNITQDRKSLITQSKLMIFWQNKKFLKAYNLLSFIKKVPPVMQIEKALINVCLCVSKVSWKFRIPTIYNTPVI